MWYLSLLWVIQKPVAGMKSILIFHSIKIILHLEPRDAIQTCCQGFLSSGLKSTKLSARMFCLSFEPRLAAGQTQVRVRPGPVTWSPVQLRAETETETGKQERILGNVNSGRMVSEGTIYHCSQLWLDYYISARTESVFGPSGEKLHKNENVNLIEFQVIFCPVRPVAK